MKRESMKLPLVASRKRPLLTGSNGQGDAGEIGNPDAMRTIRRSCFMFCSFLTIWGIVYLQYQHNSLFHGRPRPDISWMLFQRNLQDFVHPHNDTVLLQPTRTCDDVFLTIIVCSAVPNFEARLAIRNTWALETTREKGIRIYFLVGVPYNDTLESELLFEHQKYGDIIQQNFLDTYNNLTVKSVMMLKWVTGHCQQTKYLMKTDDDMFVNIANLVKYLTKRSHSNKLLLGCLITQAVPVKDWTSKWYAPDVVFSDKVYPDYLSGTGYVMSNDVAKLLYTVSLDTPFFYLEDVFVTGICAKKAGLKPTNHEGFKFYKRKNDPCIFRKVITSHRMKAQEQYTMWKRMHQKSLKCS